MVRGARAAILLAPVDLAQTANTDGFAEIDVAGDGGGADVEPVGGLWGELLEVTSLYGVDPAGNGELSLTLEEGSVGCDEFMGIHIADGNTRHDGRSIEDVRFAQMVSPPSHTKCRPNESGLVGTRRNRISSYSLI